MGLTLSKTQRICLFENPTNTATNCLNTLSRKPEAVSHASPDRS